MAIELDAEQIRNLKKRGIDPHDLVDFACSPVWASYYAFQGMTKDYPPDFYRNCQAEEEQQEAKNLSVRISILEQRLLSGPATKQDLWELKHLVNKLTERVNYLKKNEGIY